MAILGANVIGLGYPPVIHLHDARGSCRDPRIMGQQQLVDEYAHAGGLILDPATRPTSCGRR